MGDLYDKLDLDQLRVAKKVKEQASQLGLNPDLALAAFYQESGLRQSAKSKTGPVGVAQLGKAAAKDTGVNRHNEDQNIIGGLKYLKQQLESNGGDYRAALVDYHNGPGSFKAGRIDDAASKHADAVLGHFTALGGTLPNVAPAASKEVPPVPVIKSDEATTQPPSTDVADTGEFYSIEDVGAGAAGVVGGAILSPYKKKSQAEISNELAGQREKRQEVRDVNKSLTAKHNDEMAKYREALELRKQGIEAVKQSQAGSPLDVYTTKMVPGGSANVITGDPLVVSQAGVQQKIPQVQQNLQRAAAIDPMAANIDPNRGGLSVPFGVPKAPPPPSVESMFPMPQRPELQQAQIPRYTRIDRGSNLGRVGVGLASGLGATEASNALTRAQAGDVEGATLGAISAAGGAGTHLRNPKAALASGVVSAGAAGAQQLLDYMRSKREPESVLQKAEGGLTSLPKYAGRGESIVRAAVKKGEELIGREPPKLFVPRETQIMRMSEALGPHEGKYLSLTQSDNFGVHGGRMGGNQFPNFQNINPLHQRAGVVWMNDTEKHANDLVKNRRVKGKDAIFSTYIGGPDQLKSNKTVFNDILEQHYGRELTPEQVEMINNRIATLKNSKGKLIFPQAFDIRDRFATQELAGDTFERRGALASMLGAGEGVNKTRGGIALPQYEDILRSHRDPLTEGVPTSSVGTRLFSVEGRPAQYSEEFHPDYRWAVYGQDQGVQFAPVPQRIAVPDWHSKYKERFPTREPHGNAWFSYPKDPQFIDEKYLTNMQKEGYADGGAVHLQSGGSPKKQALMAGVKALLPRGEREANLERFLAPSQEQRRLYHGTRADIRGFSPFADATYLSPEPSFANRFAAQSDELKKSQALGPNPEVVERANVMPVHVQASNIFDPLNEKQSEAMRAHLLNKHKDIFERQDVQRMMAESANNYENWRQMENPLMQGGLKDLGHDAFYVNERGVRNLGVYDPKRIKSAIGNEGTYDVNVNDITKAEGGLVHLQSGGSPKKQAFTRLATSAYDMLGLTPESVAAWRKTNAKPYKQQQDPVLAQATDAYLNKQISQADYLRIMNERRPIRPLTEVPGAHSNVDIVSALDPNKVDKGILGLNLHVPEGTRVGNRLDIPSYERYGIYVDTMHDTAGKPIGYGHTGHLKDVQFKSSPTKAARVGLGTKEQALTPMAEIEGQGKSPFAMMVGNQVNTSDEEVRRMLKEYLKDPEWHQIGMNPYRASQFYDKSDMRPVWSAKEKVQAGPLVLARDIEKSDWTDPRLMTDFGVNYKEGGLVNLQSGGSPKAAAAKALAKQMMPKISGESKQGWAGTMEPVSVSLQTEKGLPFEMQREWPGKYSFNVGGKDAGAINYVKGPTGEWKPNILVNPEFQRQGIASSVYDFLEQNVTKEPFSSSGGQSEMGRAFREARQAKKESSNYKEGGLTGLYANIHAKQERIKHGSGEKMRKPGSPGAPTAKAFEESAKTAKLKDGGTPSLSVGRGEKLSVDQGAGLTAKGRAKYNRETGSNLKAPQPEGGARKDSFCARMQGVVDHAKGDAPRAKASLKRWNC